jgi:coenzyme F420 hydrogenase subunit beta
MAHGIEETIAGGMCIGCGACSVVTRGAVSLELNRYGMYVASLDSANEDQTRLASRVCPFSDDAPDEDELGAPTEGGDALPADPRVGHYSRTFVGRHSSDSYLMGSSSGGLTSWLLEQLLAQDLVDAVIHVGRTVEDGRLFQYTISTGVESVAAQRKSQYYPTTLQEVLSVAAAEKKRYVLVGVPCFIKAARLLCLQDPALNDSIRFFVGLVCGHLKSPFFAESLAWQVGIPPNELEAVDFRMKNEKRNATDYDFGALRRGDDDFTQQRTKSLVGGNWGHGAFQPEACNFCDDIFAETADVVFGDAWLLKYMKDWRGTNVVITRNSEIDRIFDEGRQAGVIDTDEISLDSAAETQSGGFRHRRDGMALRLADDIKAGLSVPRKRVKPSQDMPRKRAALVRQRRRMSRISLEAFAEAREHGEFNRYLRVMAAEIARYRKLERGQILMIEMSRVWNNFRFGRRRAGAPPSATVGTADD